MEFCRGKLSSFKRPRYVCFVDELPRTSTGKVLKRDLRKDHGGADNT
jgi:fatty-acyl-CoA synthase